MEPKPRILVIGAGIVGLCAAWYLARQGADVTLVDREGPGEGTSSGNAGAISGGSVAPLAMPGVLKQVPGMLLDPKGALHIPARYWPAAFPWLWRFVLEARPERVQEIAEALAVLLQERPYVIVPHPARLLRQHQLKTEAWQALQKLVPMLAV